MGTVSGVRTVAASPEEAFARLAAFESTAEWDPGVKSARRLDPGEPRVGTRFQVISIFAGSTVPLEYELLECDTPHRLRLVGRGKQSTAWDTIVLTPAGTGTRIRWTLDLQMKGMAKLSEPFLGPLLRRLARKALDGLAHDLDKAGT